MAQEEVKRGPGRPRKVVEEPDEEITEPTPVPVPPAPVSVPGILNTEQKAYLADHQKRYDAAVAAKIQKDSAAPPKSLGKLWLCQVCEQRFAAKGDERPRCPWGCVHPLEKRIGPQGELTTVPAPKEKS